jgi:hypothetical protein
MEKNLYEIFDEVTEAQTTLEKVEVLRKNASQTLLNFLQGVYDPSVKFDIPRVPSYKPSEDIKGMGWSNMTVELKRAYLFQKTHPKRPRELSDARQEQLLVQILESLEPREAKLYANMLMKKLEVPSMSRLLVETAFPGHLPPLPVAA